MKYKACLQRSDDAHVVVAWGDDLDKVITAATELYCSLVPEILAHGRNRVDADARAADEPETQQHAKNAKQWGWLVSERLRAEEWGIGVYEGNEMLFWIGATRDDPSAY